MALGEKQIKELNVAQERVTAGNAQGPVVDKLSGKQTNAGDVANLAHAAENGYKYTPPATGNIAPTNTSNNGLADAVEGTDDQSPFETGTGISGYDDALAAEGANAGSLDDAGVKDFINSAFGNNETPEVTAPTFDAEKARLEESKTSQLAALDATYATDLAKVQKQNKNVGNALKARLLKLGVSPTDSAWSNAEVGQASRDAAAESALESEYLSNKAKINSNSDAAISNIAMQEATMSFNASVQNTQNLLAKQNQGISLFQIFESRDQAQKDRETSANNALVEFQGTMAGLADEQQRTVSENFWKNAEAGYFNVSDEATLQHLADLENSSPYLKGLTAAASGGLTDRLNEMAQTELDRQETQMNIKETQANIGKINAATQKIITGGNADGDENPAVGNYIAQLGNYFMPEDNGQRTKSSEYFGEDGKMDSSKYNMELNNFVQSMDPDLKDISYYKKIYYTQFPPKTLLNTEGDPTAANIVRDYESILKDPSVSGSVVTINTGN